MSSYVPVGGGAIWETGGMDESLAAVIAEVVAVLRQAGARFAVEVLGPQHRTERRARERAGSKARE